MWHQQNLTQRQFVVNFGQHFWMAMSQTMTWRKVNDNRDFPISRNFNRFESSNLGYTRHSITETDHLGIVVELGTICIINHIKILLWDRDARSYSYFIEVSVNQTKWEKVIDHTKYNCRSWQSLYFPSRAVRYIRLVGTHNTCNKVFHVVALEAMYTMSTPELVMGLIKPTYNVATVEMSAQVVEGVSRTKNALLNGDGEFWRLFFTAFDSLFQFHNSIFSECYSEKL